MLTNKYDPRKKDYQELSKTFICGENIAEVILEDLELTEQGKTSRQSWIITGPRGAGKSHLVTLLFREILKNQQLSQHWLPLIFPEELFKVDCLYRLLVEVLENFFRQTAVTTTKGINEYKCHFNTIKKTQLTGNLKQKKQQKQVLAKELLELMRLVREHCGKKLILMLENLQYLLRDQIPEHEQKLLRAFVNENPDVFIIIGTALTVFNEIENYGKPFYHFFRVRVMAALDNQEIVQFLQKVAQFQNHSGINKQIDSNRHYIYTYNILTGGNPRLVLFLYDLLLDNKGLNTELILEKVSELTPYFLDKTRDESQQRKLILDALATSAPAQTATEIAHYINEEQKSITEQLKRLTNEGWTREIPLFAEGIKQKEVFYTLRDYFYRIWYQSRTSDIDQSEVYCLAELATLLFDKKEIEARLIKHTKLASQELPIYQQAHKLVEDENFTANIKLLIESSEKSEKKAIREIFINIYESTVSRDWKQILKSGRQLLDFPSKQGHSFYFSGYAYSKLKDYKKAIKHYRKTVKVRPDHYRAWCNMSLNYHIMKDYSNYHLAFREYVKLAPFYRKVDFHHIQELIVTARSISSPTEELHKLLDTRSSVEVKLEALGKLLLLGKFMAVSDSFEQILQTSKLLPADETKILDFLLEGYLLYLLQKEPDNSELKLLFKSWILLNAKMLLGQETKLKKKFLQFISFYIQLATKEKLSLQIIQQAMHDLHSEGIEISDVVLDILAAIKQPNTRAAQKWMADPLFKEIVTLLSN